MQAKRWDLFRRSYPERRQPGLKARPRLEELESRRQPSVFGLSLGGITASIVPNPVMDNTLPPGLLRASLVAAQQTPPAASISSPAFTAKLVVEIQSLTSPASSSLTFFFAAGTAGGSAVARSGSFTPAPVLIPSFFVTSPGPTTGPSLIGPTLLNGSFGQSAASSSAAGAATGASSFQSRIPNFFIGSPENGIPPAGQGTLQPGGVLLIPNFFLQNGTGFVSPAITNANPTPTPLAGPFSLQPSTLPFGFNSFLGNLGAATPEGEEGDGDNPGQGDNDQGANPSQTPTAQEAGVNQLQEETFLVPVAGLGSVDPLQENMAADQTAPFWTAISENDKGLLQDSDQQGRKLGLGSVLAASLLAVVPEWMPRPDSRLQDERKWRNRQRQV